MTRAVVGYLSGQQYVYGMSVRAATTGSNITLSGTQTVGGVALVAGDRCLVKDQTTGANNGVYSVAAGAWSRSTSYSASHISSADYVMIEEGTLRGSMWFVDTANPITVGTTALVWRQLAITQEATDYYPRPEGGYISSSTSVANTNFRGASFRIDRRLRVGTIIFWITAITVPATVTIQLFQASGAGSGTINRIGTVTSKNITATGAQTATFTEGTIVIDPGILFILMGQDSGAGTTTFRSNTVIGLDLVTSNVQASTHPTAFTTTTAANTTPTSFNPTTDFTGAGSTDVALVCRLTA